MLGRWMGVLISIFSSWPPFQDLELDPLTGALLPRCFGGMILSKRYKNPNNHNQNKIRDEKSHQNNSSMRKSHIETRKKKLTEDEKPIESSKSCWMWEPLSKKIVESRNLANELHQRHREDPNMEEHGRVEIFNTHTRILRWKRLLDKH